MPIVRPGDLAYQEDFAKGSLAQNLEELKMGRVSLLRASLDVVCDSDLLEDALILTEGQSW